MEEKKVRISFTVDAEAYKRTKDLAKQEKRSVSQMVSILLSEALDARARRA